MRFTILSMSAIALAAASAPAFAQDAPASDITVTGGATAVTDYRFRGLTQTDKKFAIQGSIGVAHSSGFYVGTWGSSIADGVAGTSDAEIDLFAGYKDTYGPATVDVGVLYYYYPGAEEFFPGYNSDFFEPYASVSGTFGPVGAKVGVAYAPKQSAIAWFNNKDDNLYTYGELSGGVQGVTLTAHVGESWGRSFLTGGLKNYTDWSLGASYAWNHLTFGVSYVDTDLKSGEILTVTGKNAGKAGVVGSIGVSF